jgi:hypothetical protein
MDSSPSSSGPSLLDVSFKKNACGVLLIHAL